MDWADGRLDLSARSVDPEAARIVVARAFGGFAAVDRMTWTEFMGARQLLVEERVGTRVREAQRAEDARVARSIEGLKRAQRGPR